MKLRKLTALGLAACLVLVCALSGCSGSTTSSTATAVSSTAESVSSTAGSTAVSSTDETASGDEAWDSADLSWKKNTDPVTMECYIDFDWYSVDTWGKDAISQYITELTGVTLDVTKASDSNQLMVLLASDSLPELIFETNQYSRFMDEDKCYTYTELIEEYCPEFMDLIDPVEIVNNTMQGGGKMFTLRSHYASQSDVEDPRYTYSPGDAGLHINETIMEELGNPSLESVEDFLSIMASVKEKYPDLIPYIPHPSWANPFCEYFGFTSATAISYDGDQAFIGMSDPGFKDWLQFMNTMMTSGYMSAEAYAYEPEQFFQICQSGSAFSCSYNTGYCDDINKAFDEGGIEGHFIPVTTALTHDGENDFQPLDYSTGWAYFFISKNCKNPDRAIQFVEFLKSPFGDHLTQWGIEGEQYTLTEDGLLQRPEGFADLTAQETGVSAWYFMASGLGEAVNTASTRLSAPDYSQGQDLREFRKEYYVRQPALAFTTPQADTDEYTIYTKLVDLWTNSQVELYSSTDFESSYNTFMENCQTIGIDTLNAYYTQAFQDALETYEEAGITF